MAYFTNAGPKSGPLRYADAPRTLPVADGRESCMPIGTATSIGWDLQKVAIWRLTAHGSNVPGTWIVVDREFRPVQ
jgi:hypothetical protein